jgi:PhnB protein
LSHQIAPVKGTVVPYLWIDGARKASTFYQNAFAAEIAEVFPPDETGRTMHVHLYINGASLIFSDPYPEHGSPYVPAAGFTLVLRVADVDSAHQQAVLHGCQERVRPTNMFWGERLGEVIDPFGVMWAFVGPKLQPSKRFDSSRRGRSITPSVQQRKSKQGLL